MKIHDKDTNQRWEALFGMSLWNRESTMGACVRWSEYLAKGCSGSVRQRWGIFILKT